MATPLPLAPAPADSRGEPWPSWAMPAAVLALALLAGGWQYGRFLAVHRHLWDSSTHDRNAHYLYSLKLATSAREGRVFRLLTDLQHARVWPPLHGVLAAGVLLVGGLDYRLAVLPSLAGWVGTAVLAFLLARAALPRGGTLAGLVAALFVLASPSHRAYATDIMLESVGACLTLLVLYCYAVAARAEPRSRWGGRCLGLAFTALFLHKYNYWALAVFAVAAAELLARPAAYRDWVRYAFAGIDWRALARGELRRPLNWLLLPLLALTAVVVFHGDRPFEAGGRSVSLYPPHNVIHAAYVVVFLRLVLWWYRGGRARLNDLDGRVRQVVLWHLCPLAVWFLLPKHPSYFLWYLSLGNAAPSQHSSIVGGIRDYGLWAMQDYHMASWSAALAAALFLVAVVCWRRLLPAGRVVLCLVLIATVLAVAHPNRKGRNLHSWVAAAWVAAGAGLAALVYGRATRRWPGARPWLGGAAVVGLAWLSAPAVLKAGRAHEGGPHPQRECVLDLTDAYLAELGRAGRATVLATVPVKPLAQWTYLERYGRLDRLEENWYGFGPPGEANREGFRNWLRSTRCDTLVFVERTAEPAVWEQVADVDLHAELRDLLEAQQVFRPVQARHFPRHGCRVTVWRRVAEVSHRP